MLTPSPDADEEETTSHRKWWLVVGGVLATVALTAVLGTAFIVLSSAQQQAAHPNDSPANNQKKTSLRFNNPLEEPFNAQRVIYKMDNNSDITLEVNGSLPVIPAHYDLLFNIPQYTNKTPDTYIGCVTIMLRAGQPVQSFVLHASKTSIMNAVRIANITPVPEQPHVKDVQKFSNGKNDFMKVNLESKLVPGAAYKLIVNFTERFKEEFGFMRRPYLDMLGQPSYVYATFFEPDNAHEAFPCFDLPNIKTTFNVTVIRPIRSTTASTMPIAETKQAQEKGYMIDRYQKSLQMSPHSLGMFVSDFKIDVVDRVRVYVPAHRIGDAAYPSRLAATLLKNFESYLYSAYPLPKLDIASFRNFRYGASSSFGLIVLSEDYLYVAPNADEADKALVANFIAHELAHQWFGNFISLKTWKDVWMHEGLATHVARIVLNQVKPAWAFLEIDRIQTLNDIFNEEYKKKLTPNAVYMDTDTIQYSELTYKKSPLLFNWLNKLAGDKAFQLMIERHLRTNAYQSVSKADLYKNIREVAKQERVLDFGPEFIDEFIKRPGYPVVTLKRKYGTGTAVVSQEPFFDSRKNKVMRKVNWKIPIDFAVPGGEPTHLMFLTSEQAETTAIPEDGWVLLNPLGSAFYRVNYDPPNWLQISHQLNRDASAIFPEGRAQLVSDVLAFADHGLLTYNVTFDVIQYIENETMPGPWVAFMSQFEALDTKMQLLDSYVDFQQFIGRLITPLLSKTTYYVRNAEPLFHTKIRPSIGRIACIYGHPSCVSYSKKLFQWLYVTNDLSTLEVNHNIPYVDISHILCNAVKFGTPKDFEQLWNRMPMDMEVSKNRVILNAMLHALSCVTTDEQLLYMIEGPLKNPKRFLTNNTIHHFYSAVTKSRRGRELTFRFIVENFEKFFTHPAFAPPAKGPNTKLENIMRQLLVGLGNTDLLNRFHVLVAEHSHLIKKVRMDNALVQISRELNEISHWISVTEPIVKEWLSIQKQDLTLRRKR